MKFIALFSNFWQRVLGGGFQVSCFKVSGFRCWGLGVWRFESLRVWRFESWEGRALSRPYFIARAIGLTFDSRHQDRQFDMRHFAAVGHRASNVKPSNFQTFKPSNLQTSHCGRAPYIPRIPLASPHTCSPKHRHSVYRHMPILSIDTCSYRL